MQPAKALRYGIVLMLLVTLLGATQGKAAPLHQDEIWVITSPSDGAVVSGQVTVQGTATHPNFASYGVLYAAGTHPTGESQWKPVVLGVQTMVVNGPLATWDTTTLPNGKYTLALALYEAGNTEPKLHFVNNLTVQNEEPTPEPTTEEPTPEETQPPVEGETPPPDTVPAGPTVEQPATATAAPVAPPQPGEETSDDDAEEDAALLSVDAMRQTFCTGVWYAVMLYIFGGIYVAGRAAWRYYQRQQRKRTA